MQHVINPFNSFRNYEEYIYTIQQNFSLIKSTNLIFIRRGKRVATIQGEMIFDEGYRIIIRERLSFDAESTVVIESYGYELWHNNEKIALYDSQPHPNIPSLAGTHPHHKHIKPNIKHNRVLSPKMSFTRPNLKFLIEEVNELIIKVNE